MFGLNDPFGFNSHINSIMNSFMSDPFGQPPNGNQQNRNNRSNQQRSNDPFGMALSPFDMHSSSLMSRHQQAMNNPFALMNQMMANPFSNNVFNSQFEQMGNDPNTQVYSSSSVMSYSNTGDGKPKIYQASSQVRQAAGGVKETRHMVRDSERGLEKVSVGHHIGERAHVIERQKLNGGPVEEVVNLENLDDGEINEFNREFETKISHMRTNGHHQRHHIGSNQPLAIEDTYRKKDKSKSKSKSKH